MWLECFCANWPDGVTWRLRGVFLRMIHRSLAWSSAWCSAVPSRGPGTLSERVAQTHTVSLTCLCFRVHQFNNQNRHLFPFVNFGSMQDGRVDLWAFGPTAPLRTCLLFGSIIPHKLNKAVLFSLQHQLQWILPLLLVSQTVAVNTSVVLLPPRGHLSSLLTVLCHLDAVGVDTEEVRLLSVTV